MKPSLPQGTRDFGADIVKKRNYIFDIIRHEFELFGFQPLETPAFENIDTLMGKYGDEGDKLIFKILNNGLEREEKHEQAKSDFEQVLIGKSVKGLTERALKYDLTIPFARYVAMNHGQMTFPFKRYQIQPVWRADKPQRGRYREFYQCDADIVGSKSLSNEIDLIQLYTNVFQKLGLDVQICVNNRKILAALAELCGGEQYLVPITIAIDKIDKIGYDNVMFELEKKEISAASQKIIGKYLALSLKKHLINIELLYELTKMFKHIPIGMEGVEELRYIVRQFSNIKLDVTLARGLNYYTGTILEVKPMNILMGSIGGGGRYDDLTGLFDVPDVPGVGISFGVDRIYDVMEEKNLFPKDIQMASAKVMLVNFGAEFEKKNREILSSLRKKNISCELYPEDVKFDKQLKYANKKQIAYIILIGEDELKENYISIKNFQTGEQHKVQLEALDEIVK